MIFEWLRRVWLWLRENVVFFVPRLISSKRDHGSDCSSSDEDKRTRRLAPVPGTEIFDEIDHLTTASRRPRAHLAVADGVQYGQYIAF